MNLKKEILRCGKIVKAPLMGIQMRQIKAHTVIFEMKNSIRSIPVESAGRQENDYFGGTFKNSLFS